jgi:predicted Zn-dependent protease
MRIYQAVYAADSTRVDLLRSMASVMLGRGEVDMAVSTLERAVMKDPASALGLALLSLAYAQAGHAAEAAQAGSRAARMGRDDPQTLLIVAQAMAAAGRPAEAVQFLDDVARRWPDDRQLAERIAQARSAIRGRAPRN